MKEQLPDVVLGPDGKPVAGLQGAIIKAIGVQRPLVIGYLRRLRRKHPDATAAELARLIERDYLLAVTGGGAAVGATAAVPGVGTAASLGLSVAATVGFLEASALYAQSLAELHGITTEDPAKARAMVMAILMGDEGSSMISSLTHQVAGRGAGPVQGWGAVFGASSQKGLWGGISGNIQRRFLRKMLATQGASVLGRAIPFGVGAAIGGVGNRFLGKKVVEAASLAFGPLPTVIPGELELETQGAGVRRRELASGADGTPGGAPSSSVSVRTAADEERVRRLAEEDVERRIEAERLRRGGSQG
ncbi:hypothetical protein ACQ3I4_14380 [Zafaria sp. Z1313]|uniref:hypothetical protein n=1 Tax=unclassified Zafaria TaxID=2828765 RepID=UPI002E784929|nr:hypothetical protein [Zafaria sp. J156]MEE1622110.1 hypothetical protein [Zafaria sp. J156]